jgi:uncharacterized protein (UPF0335 family)
MKEQVDAATADELRQFIERIEHLAAEKQGIADQIREVMAEASGRGYVPAQIREIVKLRKMKPDDRAEREAILGTYLAALGMA